MAAEHLASLFRAMRGSPTRRTMVRGLTAGVLATVGIAAEHDRGDAGKAAERRRKRRARRRRCEAVCAGPCDFCFYDTEGGIHCADGSGFTCHESAFCSSSADCTGAVCLRAVQMKGSAAIRPLADASCDFPDGICSALAAGAV